MSGRRWNGSAQLAVLDAVIFFAAAVLISSMMMFDFSADNPQAITDLKDPSELLPVFLSASLGEHLILGGDHPAVLKETDTVGDCVLAEAMSISDGDDPGGFRELNEIVARKMSSAAGPSECPHLLVWLPGGFQQPLISIPDELEEASEVRASSMELSAGDHEFVIGLALLPASGAWAAS